MEKYTIIKKIGEGSFGNALLVKLNESGKHLVMKEVDMKKVPKYNVTSILYVTIFPVGSD